MNFRKIIMGCSVYVFAAGMVSPLTSTADVRQDAYAVLQRLKRAGIDVKMPAEVASASETVATADMYYTSSLHAEADKFYLLALQKARIIMASIPGGIPELPNGEALPPASLPLQSSRPPTGIHTSVKTPLNDPGRELLPEKSMSPDTSPDSVNNRNAADDLEDTVIADEIVSDKIIGTMGVYTVVKGDSMSLVSAKLGVSRDHLARENRLSSNRSPLKVGQKLRYNNRKIIPQRVKNGIIINVPDRTLYFFKQGKLAISLPVALGVPVVNEKYDWRTPLGKFRITAKVKDPTWYVPPSIQSEMEEHGKEVITSIPPGPENPLGQYALKTSLPGILIHSTIKPASIYGFASHGCIRVYPERMEELFREIKVSTPGEIIYRPVKLAVTENGKVLLEAHKDVYDKSGGIGREVRSLIEKHRLGDRVDWNKVDYVIRQKTGIAEDVTLTLN